MQSITIDAAFGITVDLLKDTQAQLKSAMEVIEYYSEGMAHCDRDHYNNCCDNGHVLVSSGKRARDWLKENECKQP